jgi:hypothetical protein
MLDNRTVLAKTDSGRDAIANRTHNLNPRQRALLISINGETDLAGLLGRFGGGTPEAATAIVETLIELGLVVGTSASEPSPAAAVPTRRWSRARAAEPSGNGVASLPAVDEDTLKAFRTPPAQIDHVPDDSRPGVSVPDAWGRHWREMQQRAGDSLHAAMGSEADLLAMRLARSRTETEFLSHMERAFDLIRAARGEDAALAFHRDVSGSA